MAANYHQVWHDFFTFLARCSRSWRRFHPSSGKRTTDDLHLCNCQRCLFFTNSSQRHTQTTCMFSNTLMWMSITTSLNTTTNCLESSTLDHVLWAQALHIVVVGTRYVPRCVERWAPMPSLCLKCGWREVHGQDANSRQWTWLMHRTLPGYKSYSLKVVSEELLAPCFGTIGTLFPD